MLAKTLEKVCTKCGEPKSIEYFCKDSGYKDGRRSDCNGCRQIARSTFRRELEEATRVPAPLGYALRPYHQTTVEQDLPDPERLPAAYMKRVSDYWVDLIGGVEPTTRIA